MILVVSDGSSSIGPSNRFYLSLGSFEGGDKFVRLFSLEIKVSSVGVTFSIKKTKFKFFLVGLPNFLKPILSSQRLYEYVTASRLTGNKKKLGLSLICAGFMKS